MFRSNQMSIRSISPQNWPKIRQIKFKCSQREAQIEKSSAVNSSDFQFALAGICYVCDSKSLEYFVIKLKIDQLQAYKDS